MNNINSRPGFFAAFFGFKRMVSPFFITLVYFLGLIGIIACVVKHIMQGPNLPGYLVGYMDQYVPGDMQTYVAYALVVLGGFLVILVWRFVCELLISLFGIFNRLSEIKVLLGEPVSAAASAARVKATIAPAKAKREKPKKPTKANKEKAIAIAAAAPVVAAVAEAKEAVEEAAEKAKDSDNSNDDGPEDDDPPRSRRRRR
ncbi:MAG: hypothetical protein COA47_12360 [Robiginitomaculum sp.]|nr:MAG: hypothetical protein COA47_12360 [Robiginitomaculum sp.]